MSKIIKLLAWIGVTLAGIIVLAGVIVFILFPGEKIKAFIEERATKEMGMPVSLGSVGISFMGIPSIVVSDLTIGPAREGEMALMRVKSVGVRIDLIKLLKKKIDVVSVKLNNPEIVTITREDGSTNLPKKVNQTSQTHQGVSPPLIPLPVTLREITINDAHLELDNKRQKSWMLFDGVKSTLMVTIDNNFEKLILKGSSSGKNITYTDTADKFTISGLSGEFVHEVTGNPITGNFTITKGDLVVNGIPLVMNGSLTGWTNLAYVVKADNVTMEQAVRAVPDSLLPIKKDISAKGTLSFSLSGTTDLAPLDPIVAYNGTLNIQNASLSYKGLHKSIETMSVSIMFTEKDLEISHIKIASGSSHISLSGTVKNYDKKPAIAVTSIGSVNLNDVAGFIPLLKGKNIKGSTDFQFALAGTSPLMKTASISGGVTLNNVSLDIPDMLHNSATMNGTVAIDTRYATFERITLKSGKSDAVFQGRINNYLTLAKLDDNPPVLKGSVTSQVLDLNDLLVMKKKKESSSSKPWDLEKTLMSLPIPPNLSAVVDIRLGKVNFGRMKTDSVKGTLALGYGALSLNDISVKAYEGSLTGKTALFFADTSRITYNGEMNLKELEAKHLIADFFGAGEIVSGKMSTSLTFSGAGLDSVSMLKNLTASGKISIVNGEIRNWEPTRELGKFLKFLDFDVLAFNDMTNTFRVEHEKVITPDIALNTKYGAINANGSTGFDTSLDYHITMLLNEKTSGKALDALSSLATLFQGKAGKVHLDVTATGSFRSPKFKLETSSVQQQVKEKVGKKVDEFLDKQDEAIKQEGKKLLKKLLK
jgi:hypothetical protein